MGVIDDCCDGQLLSVFGNGREPVFDTIEWARLRRTCGSRFLLGAVRLGANRHFVPLAILWETVSAELVGRTVSIDEAIPLVGGHWDLSLGHLDGLLLLFGDRLHGRFDSGSDRGAFGGSLFLLAAVLSLVSFGAPNAGSR